MDTTYRNDFMKCMDNLRRFAQYTDVTLLSGDVNMPCHRAVLAVASEYFNAMFSCGLNECTSSVVELPMEPDTLSSIVEYVYTGEIELTAENVESLVKATDLLHLDTLKAACDTFMLSHVEPANCVGFYQFAKLYRIDQLQQKARRVMCAEFNSVARHAELKQLTCDELIDWIKDDDVVVENEDIVCESVLDWVRYNVDNRRSSLETILQYVRLPYCTTNYLWHTKDTCDLLTPKCREYIDEAFKFQADTTQQQQVHSCRTVPRANCRMKSCLVVFGTQNRNHNAMGVVYSNVVKKHLTHKDRQQLRYKPLISCCYNEDSKRWENLMVDFRQAQEEMGFSLCCMDKGVLQTGGGNNCWLLNFATKTQDAMPRLTSARYHHGSVSLGNRVYVVGGTGLEGDPLPSVECLSLRERRWLPVPDLPVPVVSPMVVACTNKVYVVGGMQQGDPVCCTQIFDTTWGLWRTGSDMPEPCTGGAAVVLNSAIYVVGGDNRTCLRYEPSSDSWEKLSPPRRPHSEIMAVVWRGSILVATRGTISSALPCERYSPSTDSWSDWIAPGDLEMLCHSMFSVDLYDMTWVFH